MTSKSLCKSFKWVPIGSMYVHEMSPYILQFSENFGVQWYGFSFMLSFFFAYIFIRWMVYRQRFQLQPLQVGDFVMVSFVGALIGARLGYCLLYDPNLFLMFRNEFPYWGPLAISEGGLSSYGGILGLLVASTIFALRLGVSRLYLYDLIAVTAPVTLFFGRLANFINGELIGRVAPEGSHFAVKFPSEILSWPLTAVDKLKSLAPVSETLFKMNSEAWISTVDQMATDENAKQTVAQALVHVVHSRSTEMVEALTPYLEPRYPVQIYAALAEGLVLFLILFIFWYRPRISGAVSSTFLVLYSMIYFALEQFREPDVHLGLGWLDLTRGQFLSIFAFIIGLVLMFLWGRRETLSVSGWGRGQSVKLHRR